MRWPLIFVMTMLSFAGSAEAASGELWVVAGDNVNLRRGPGSGHEIKRQLSRDQKVIERGQDAEWRHVEIVGATGLFGWVHQSLLIQGQNTAERNPPEILEMKLEDPTPKTPITLRDAFREKDRPPEEAIAPAGSPEDILEEMRGYVQRREDLPKDPAPRIGRSGREILSPVPIRKPGDQSRIPTELVLASSPEVAGMDVEAMENFRDSVSYLNSRAWSVAGIKLFSEIEPVGGGVVQVKTTKDWFDVPTIGQTSYLNTLVDRWASAKADGAPAGVMLVDPTGDLLMHQSKP